MKLFQQLLVAPAALGLFSPLAANAAEVNLNGVAEYASYEETFETEVTTSQFSDVVPGDWAYTALQNLSESYGCVDNAYTQNLRSGQALTRYEAASLVNACLDNGIASADVDSDALRLSNEFGTEMAILKGRVDGLEYKVQELSAGQFSSATKMSGQAVFAYGAVDTAASTTDNKLASTYSYKVDLNSSFNGTDLLTATFEAGNVPVAHTLDSSYGFTTANTLELSHLSYSFPVGDDFQVTVGPLMAQDDVISATTQVYSGAFRLGAMPYSTNSNLTGPTLAVEYVNDSGFNATVSTVASGGATATNGIWTDQGSDYNTIALGYDGDRFGGGLIYTTQDQGAGASTQHDTTFGGGVYFTPDGFPTISVSYDTYSDADAADNSNLSIGFDYPVGPGTASAAYQSVDTAGTNTSNYEVYYNYPVTDGIEIQGGMFVEGVNNANDTVGYMVETFFKF